MTALIVIPARYGSTRFPGKPLQEIAGVSLLRRTVKVAERVAARTGARFLVATDDERIAAHAAEADIPFVMTPKDIASGTDRALAALEAAKFDGPAPELVVNLQGDAPFVAPEHLTAIIDAATTDPGADVTTPVIQLDWAALDALIEHKQANPFSGTTCIRKQDGYALWFSKRIIPALRKEEKLRTEQTVSPIYRHIGLYCYRVEALRRFAELPPSPYEELEGLEQLRFLENGMSVLSVEVAPPRISMSGIDAPGDVALAEKLIAEHGDPYHDESAQP